MTIIEIRPFRNGWKCFEASGVEPIFLEQEQAIDYATGRACFRSGEIRILDASGDVERNDSIQRCRQKNVELLNLIRADGFHRLVKR